MVSSLCIIKVSLRMNWMLLLPLCIIVPKAANCTATAELTKPHYQFLITPYFIFCQVKQSLLTAQAMHKTHLGVRFQLILKSPLFPTLRKNWSFRDSEALDCTHKHRTQMLTVLSLCPSNYRLQKICRGIS